MGNVTTPENIFRHSKMSEADDMRIEERLLRYMEKRYDFLKYVGGRKSYAIRRYEFLIEEPEFIGKGTENELSKNLNIVLAAENCRAFTYRDRMIINVPRDDRETLYLGEGLDEFVAAPHMPVSCYIGERDDGTAAIVDFSDIPHLLIGGTTGSGKSVCLNDIILSMAYKYPPQELNFYIIDDKHNLNLYKDLPHTKASAFTRDEMYAVVAEMRAVLDVRKDKIGEGEEIDEYNELHPDKKLPYVFLIFDEADTILKANSGAGSAADSAKGLVEEVTAQGRSLGIHVIIASQKPSKANIDTTIKSNVPGRIALQVVNSIDSRVIIDEKGAEKLTGNGDGLIKLNGKAARIQCALTEPAERKKAVNELRRYYAKRKG